MGEFLSFRKMITPVIIKLIFVLGVIACFIGGIVVISQGKGDNVQTTSGVIILILGPLMVRIFCEMMILFFRMHDALTEIAQNTKKSND